MYILYSNYPDMLMMAESLLRKPVQGHVDTCSHVAQLMYMTLFQATDTYHRQVSCGPILLMYIFTFYRKSL
jgi:hypothetical protein